MVFKIIKKSQRLKFKISSNNFRDGKKFEKNWFKMEKEE